MNLLGGLNDFLPGFKRKRPCPFFLLLNAVLIPRTVAALLDPWEDEHEEEGQSAKSGWQGSLGSLTLPGGQTDTSLETFLSEHCWLGFLLPAAKCIFTDTNLLL